MLQKLDVQSNVQLFLQQYSGRVQFEPVQFVSDRVQVIPGYLFSPKTSPKGARHPGIVLVHGGFHDHLDT